MTKSPADRARSNVIELYPASPSSRKATLRTVDSAAPYDSSTGPGENRTYDPPATYTAQTTTAKPESQ